MEKEKCTICKCALILCIIFSICCVLFTFAPHLHECAGSECATCALIKVVYDVLSVLCFATVISLSVIGCLRFFAHFADGQSVREATLVGHKVKLSD